MALPYSLDPIQLYTTLTYSIVAASYSARLYFNFSYSTLLLLSGLAPVTAGVSISSMLVCAILCPQLITLCLEVP